jgi:hypothetical protein
MVKEMAKSIIVRNITIMNLPTLDIAVYYLFSHIILVGSGAFSTIGFCPRIVTLLSGSTSDKNL